jgi:hypothetical protein
MKTEALKWCLDKVATQAPDMCDTEAAQKAAAGWLELDSLVTPAVTSSDVERAATLAWNEAIEEAAKAVWEGRLGQSRSETASAIRALKRTA